MDNWYKISQIRPDVSVGKKTSRPTSQFKVLRKVQGGEWGDTGERVEAVSPAQAEFLYLKKKPEYRGRIVCSLDYEEEMQRRERRKSQMEIKKNKPKQIQEFLQKAWWNND